MGRVLALSDGVFAIAMTLLVLDIKIPDDVQGARFTQALNELAPSLAGYVLSFLVIGALWLGHHRLFRALEKVHGRTATLNVLLLGFVALLPFPASLMTKHGGESMSYILFAANACAVFLLQALITGVEQYHGSIRPMAGRLPRFGWYLGPITACVTFAVWVLVAVFVNPNYANYTWFLLIPFRFVTQGLAKNKGI